MLKEEARQVFESTDVASDLMMIRVWYRSPDFCALFIKSAFCIKFSFKDEGLKNEKLLC
jgi:hypothetical protein